MFTTTLTGTLLTDTTTTTIVEWVLPDNSSGMNLAYSGLYLSITATGGKTYTITYQISHRSYPTKFYPVVDIDGSGVLTARSYSFNSSTLPVFIYPLSIPEDTYSVKVTLTSSSGAGAFTLEILGTPSLV